MLKGVKIVIDKHSILVNNTKIFTATANITNYYYHQNLIILHYEAQPQVPTLTPSILAIDIHGEIRWQVDTLRVKSPDRYTQIELYNNQLIGHTENIVACIDPTNGKIMNVINKEIFSYYQWHKECRTLYKTLNVRTCKEHLLIDDTIVYIAPDEIINFVVYSDKIILLFKSDMTGPHAKHCVLAINFKGGILWVIDKVEQLPHLYQYIGLFLHAGKLFVNTNYDWTIAVSPDNGRILATLFTK